MLSLGLRFSRSQARVLRNLASDLRARRPPGIDISLFDKAAESAADDEPLVVLCDDPAEVELMAQLFADLGIKRPTIDGLSV
jgi:hypothetical protein